MQVASPHILSRLTACPHCDLLLSRVEPPAHHSIICPECGHVLAKKHTASLETTLALSITGLLLYLPAILMPLITFEKLGFSEQGNVVDTILGFYQNGYYIVAGIVLLSAIVLPIALLLLIFTVSLQLKTGSANRLTSRLFRLYVHLEEWAMVEVYLLGILVTIIKMYSTADISYNSGFFSFLALVFITLGITAVLDRGIFWQWLDFSEKSISHPTGTATDNDTLNLPRTAAQAGLTVCLTCNKLHSLNSAELSQPPHCLLCGSRLHNRKPQSLSRTWALVCTSAVLLFPANILPIMRVDFLGIPDNSTIIDGILYFFEHGSYLIGLIIFIASIVVPLFKISGLTILLITTKFKKSHFLRQKAIMFRSITFIGRWSMLDIFVIALLGTLVDFGFFTSIHAAPAATYFCLVVVATMFAAITFDPRIMWDRCRPCSSSPTRSL